MGLFKSKKETSLGIDIGSSAIKIVELAKGPKDKIQLINYGEFTESMDATLEPTSAKFSASHYADIIKGIMKEAGITRTKASISLPLYAGFSTVISMPDMSEEELDQAVLFEARKYIPLPLSEVQFEWVKIPQISRIVSSSKGEENGKNIDILIIAVTNELISKYHEIAKLSNLKLQYLELDTFSLARSLIDNHNIPTLIISIGSANTIFSVMENEWPVFTRTIDISGHQFSGTLSSSLGITLERAEELKIQKGINAGEGILIPIIDSIFTEGRRIIEVYARSRNAAIKKVILSGGSSRIPGLLTYIKKYIDIDSMISFSFRDIIYPEILESTLREIGPSFDVAVGLALRELK